MTAHNSSRPQITPEIRSNVNHIWGNFSYERCQRGVNAANDRTNPEGYSISMKLLFWKTCPFVSVQLGYSNFYFEKPASKDTVSPWGFYFEKHVSS